MNLSLSIPNRPTKIAKQVSFVQRSSKYQADELIALCVWLSQEVASTSLLRNYLVG